MYSIVLFNPKDRRMRHRKLPKSKREPTASHLPDLSRRLLQLGRPGIFATLKIPLYFGRFGSL